MLGQQIKNDSKRHWKLCTMPNGVNVTDIMVRTPRVILDAFDLQSLKIKIDFACQADTSSTSSESWFGKFLEHMDGCNRNWIRNFVSRIGRRQFQF